MSNPLPGPSLPGSMGPISPEDENILRYFLILRPTGPAAIVLATVCKELYCGGQQSVKDYCINSLGFSSAQFRKAFTTHERDTLEVGTSWDSFDITFLYKLLQRVCGLAPSSDKKWADPDPQDTDELEHNIYLVKDKRNFLAHEAVSLTDLELEDHSRQIKASLEKLLNKTSLKKNVDFSQDVASMKSKINNILYSITRLSLQGYQKALENLRCGIARKMVKDSQNELFPKYLKLYSSALEGWSHIYPVGQTQGNVVPTVGQVFTNMTIKDKSETEVAIQDLFCYCLSDGSLPRLLIIEGIAGIGKSYICKYILNKWASQNASGISLIGVEIIIFIQCHSVNSDSLREYLSEELLQQTCSNIQHEDVLPALRKCHVLFIIDGIDESGSRTKGILREVNTKFPTSRVLITCRPEFTEEAQLLILKNSNSFSIFNAKGFNHFQRKEYLTKLLTIIKVDEHDHKRNTEFLYRNMQELEHMHSLLCLPLSMMMIVQLWLDDASSLSLTTTVNYIHQKTIAIRIKQLAQTMLRKPKEKRHIRSIEYNCKQWLKTLTKVAREMLRCNTQVLDARYTTELIETAEKHNIDHMDAMSSFLKCTTLQNMSDTEYVWEFFHKSFQEYLSALYERSEMSKSQQAQSTFATQGLTLIVAVGFGVVASISIRALMVQEKASHHSAVSSMASVIGSMALALAIGLMVSAIGSMASARGSMTSAIGSIASARGSMTSAIGSMASARGSMTSAIGSMASARGSMTSAIGSMGSATFPTAGWNSVAAGSLSSASFSTAGLQSAGAATLGADSALTAVFQSSDVARDPVLIPGSNSAGADAIRSTGVAMSNLISAVGAFGISGLAAGAATITRARATLGFSKYLGVDGPSDNSNLQSNAKQQNMLQFLGAMEAAEENVDYERMKHIVISFNQTLLVCKWVAWATFLRECKEHPVACQLIQHILNGEEINIWDLKKLGICENLDAIKYLLKKTRFIPGEVKLWFTKEDPFPEVLGSVLCTLAEVSPTTITKLKCSLKNSLALQLCLAQQKTFDLIDLSLMGEIAKAKSDDFIGLMKYLGEQDAQFKLQVIIKNTENLTEFAKCCMIVPLPKRTELQLFVYCASEEMLNPLCQILSAFSWMKSFTFTFTHTELGDKTADVQELLIEALQQDTVQLINVELVVEAYAESCLKSYQEMAHAIAGNVPTAVVFNDWADGDDVSLVFQGVRKP